MPSPQGVLSLLDHPVAQETRIAIRPAWVGLLGFETRFPSAIEAAMAHA